MQIDVSATVDNTIGQIEALTQQDVAPGDRLTRLHTNKVTEYLGEAMKLRLQNRQIYHTTTMGYDPTSNGLAERVVGPVKEQARTTLQAAQLPDNVWPWASEHACEQARSKLLAPITKLTPFGAEVAIRKNHHRRSKEWL